MTKKHILLFEKYDGVRFVLERSLSRRKEPIEIHSSSQKENIKATLTENHIDLLITELTSLDKDGMEITKYAREVSPDLKIIWITVLGCDVFRKQKKQLGDVQCYEKPVDITHFRRGVMDALLREA